MRIIDSYFQRILNEYPETYKTLPKLLCVANSVTHPITTTGSTVYSEVLRLALEKMGLFKNEFELTIELGVIRLLNSSWAVCVRVVSEKNCKDEFT